MPDILPLTGAMTWSTATVPALEAAAQAAAAASAAGVVVQPVESAEACWRAADLLREVWRSAQFPVAGNVLRMVAHTGGYVAAAYDEVRGDLLAVSLGFLATDGLHSHITGVLPSGQGRGLGYALKLHQRSWCLDRGISTVTWTSDPLVRRNDRFNLHSLGAVATGYLVDFYGPMDDEVNCRDESDRLSWRWDLRGPRASEAAERRLPPAQASGLPHAVAVDARGRPVLSPVQHPRVLVSLPEDVEALRRDDPESARSWRLAVRAAVQPLLAAGGRVVGLTEAGELVLETAA